MYLAAALRHLRAVCSTRPNPPISVDCMPLEWEYADDTDFIDEDKEILTNLLVTCSSIFKEWNLQVNSSKTEFIKFHVAEKYEIDDKGELIRGREYWRQSISLGSKIDSEADITQRCSKANSAFHFYNKLWLKGTSISLCVKLKLYEALVTSVLLYNCSSWTVTAKNMKKLDVCQRKHLRQIVKMQWPKNNISNANLYKICKCQAISDRVAASRWRMLGHILRGDETNPAFLALNFVLTSNVKLIGRIGRHQSTLMSTIRRDLLNRHMQLNTAEDLCKLREYAMDRKNWKYLETV